MKFDKTFWKPVNETFKYPQPSVSVHAREILYFVTDVQRQSLYKR